MEKKFTPGVWSMTEIDTKTDTENSAPVIIESIGFGKIYAGPHAFSALRGRTKDEAMVNARLISSAPKMYELLEKVLSELRGYDITQGWYVLNDIEYVLKDINK